MVVKNANIDNIMKGMESTGGVRLHNHRRKLKQRFDIIRKLGQGTYGKVQLGINKETGQEVAIKTIKKAKIETEADLVRIRREIQIMSSVQHPNIIHIYEVFENREKMVLVMEYAAGGELYDYLNERKVLSQDEARRIFRQIATAVYYCHKHKICHRDLKLENILLDEQGSAKIADFGLSNVFDEKRLLNTFCGSPLYASPEIVKGTPYYGPEVDCWSLGVLLYTLVYGAMPFDGSNFKRLVKQISQGDYFEPKKTSPASSLIREMLAVSPAKRADIQKVCSHWWVNEGYTESCFDIAEELASQTPVRLDLLLSLAPAPSGVSTENIMQQGLAPLPPVSHSDMPVRCHSMGSLMDINHTPNEQAKLLRKQSFLRSGPVNVQYTTGASPDYSAKRKLEEGASCSDINLKEIKHDEGSKRNAVSYSKDQPQAEQVNLPDSGASKQNITDERMDVEPISDPALEKSCINDLTDSNILSKDSGVDTQEEASGTHTMSTCESSTSTIVPADSLSPSRSSFVDELSGNELAASDSIDRSKLNQEHGLQSSAVTQDSENVIHRDGAETSVKLNNDELSSEKSPSISKEGNKTLERRKEKIKKTGSSPATSDVAKGARSKTKEDNASVSPKGSVKLSESASKKTAAPPLGTDSEVQKSNIEISKEKCDLPSKNTISNSEPISSLTKSTEMKSKAAGSVENLNNVLTNSEVKTGVKEKPKKLFIPGVKVSDFKKAFERKLSSPEISAVSFGRRSSMKSDEPISDKFDNASNISRSNESQRNVGQAVINQSNDSLNIVSNTQVAKPKIINELQSESTNVSKGKQVDKAQNSEVSSNSPRALSHLNAQHASDETKAGDNHLVKNVTDTIQSISRENVPDPDKVKPLKSSSDSNRIKSVTSSTLIGTPLEGKDAKKNIQSPISTNDDNTQTVCIDNKPEDNKTISSPQPKPAENTGNKKRSKVEITLKSATLPRRKTSKAEIKLDPAIPPIEYKTEIEHMVSHPTTIPFPEKTLSEEIAGAGSTQSFRSWSLEPEGSPQSQGRPHECIIPIQIESGSRENPNLGSPTSARPPAYPFQQRSNSQTQRSRTLLHQSSSQESDSLGGMEKIRKSPREFIIPIAMEGGGYVTPRATSLEPSTSDDGKTSFASSRSNHFRRMSSLLSDTSEDEGLSMSSPGLQRHGSLNRDKDDARNFHFHRLRSSRPMRNSLERNDSLSSAEEDDDDDEGFEILTAESLFSTLLSRVRSLTQRLTVEDAKAPGFPSNHFVNQMSNIGNTSRPWKRFYDFHREPLSRRLSETSSFSRLLNYGGEHGPENGRGLSRDSSNSSNTNTESSCTMRTFPRGAPYLKGSPSDTERREIKRSFTPLHHASRSRGNVWQEELANNNLASFAEPSFRNSSSTKSMFQPPTGTYQSNNASAPRTLIRTHSLRAASEDRRLSDSPLHRNYSNKFSSYPKSGQCNQIGVSDVPYNSFGASSYQKGKQKYSLSRNLAESTSSLLNQNTSSPSKNSNIPSFPRSKLQNPKSVYRSSERETNNTRDESHRLPKHCSSLPSLADVPKTTTFKSDDNKTPLISNKLKSKAVNIGNSHKSGDKKTSPLNSSDVAHVCNEPKNENNFAPIATKEIKQKDKNGNSEEFSRKSEGDIKLGDIQTINSSSLKSDSGSSSKSCKQQTVQKSSLPKKNKVISSVSSVSGGTENSDPPNPQERRKSRFLRPDFFDTPPEESAYVKERENKKAAEAELKKARRLSRRAVSMREIFPSGIQDDKSSVISTNENKNNAERSADSTTFIRKGIQERKSPPKNCPNLESGSSKDMKNSNPSLLKKPREEEKILGSVFPSPKTRVEKNILSLTGKNSSPWDMKMIATESTYLKRAVSVDDVSVLDKKLISKSNAKLGGKISSVLKLFSKSDTPELSKHHSSPRIFGNNENVKTNKDNQLESKESPDRSWVGKRGYQSSTEIKQSHSAQSIPIEMSTKGINTRFLVTPLKSIENSERQNKSNDVPSGGSRSILGDGKPGRSVSSANALNEGITRGNQSSSENSWSQAPKLPSDVIGDETKNEDLPELSLPNNSEDLKLCKLHSTDLAETFDYKANIDSTSQAAGSPYNANRSTNASPLNEIEHADSCSDCSNINTPDNVSVCADDVDKDIESVEDRIRRKSFYTRFNDVKKKVRKKSPQLFKDGRSTPSPSHQNVKSNENQTFLQQNTGGMPEKTQELGHSDHTHDIFPEISSNTLATYQDVSLGNPLESLSTNTVRDENNLVCNTSNSSTTIPTLLRPAAFVQSVLDNSSPSKLRSSNKKEAKFASNSEDISLKKNDTSKCGPLQNANQASPSSS